MTIKIGDMIVLTSTKKDKRHYDRFGRGMVMYIKDDFPMVEMNILIDQGFYTIREATTEEKEFCYFCYEQSGYPGCNLDSIEEWRTLKRFISHEHLHSST